jgi:phosphohistidine swiveling domain-containing protein
MAENIPDKDSFKAWHDYFTEQAKKSHNPTREVVISTRPIGGGISVRGKQEKLTSVVTKPREGSTTKSPNFPSMQLTSPAVETVEKAISEIEYNNEIMSDMPKHVIHSSRGRKKASSSSRGQKRKTQSNTGDIFSKKFKVGK